MAEQPTYTQLAMDRSEPIGNSIDRFSRRAIHTKVGNLASEPIPVTPVAGAYGQVSLYNESTAVPQNVLTTIQSYVVPLGQTFYFEKCSLSGENIARYFVKVNGSTIDSAYTWFAEGLSHVFNFASALSAGYPVSGGQTLTVQVIHLRPMTGDFNSRIQGVLV